MPMFARGWIADYPDIHNFVFPFLHSQGRYPLSQGYVSAQMDRLIEQALEEVLPAKRRVLYSRVQKLAFDEVTSIPVVHPVGLFALRTEVQGFVDNPVDLSPQFYSMRK